MTIFHFPLGVLQKECDGASKWSIWKKKKRKREDRVKFHLNKGEEHTDEKVELLFKNLPYEDHLT